MFNRFKNIIDYYGDSFKYNKVWFTSDQHFGSTRHIQLSQRVEFFPDKLKEMNNVFIARHNEVVSEDDLVIHLGDFGSFKYLPYLNGQHILIKGNYEYDSKDFYNEISKPEIQNKLIACLDNMYIDYRSMTEIFSEKLCDRVECLFLTHKPENCRKNSDGGLIEMTSGKYLMNIFGHIHEKAKIKRYGLNVGLDSNHYYPLSSEVVEFYLLAILDHYDNNVFK